MKVQRINQSSIYQNISRQDGSVNFSKNCCPKPKPNVSMQNVSMPSFKGKSQCKKAKTLMEEVGSLVNDTYNYIKRDFNKSNTKKVLVAPIQKKWSDFASKAPKFSQAVKGAFYVTAGVTAFDFVTGKFLK